MDAFIQDTKHKPHQLETDEDVIHVARKFLATQIPKFVKVTQVYPRVSDDMTSIEFRAPGVLEATANQRVIDPIELESLVSHPDNLSLAKECIPNFAEYVQWVRPPVGKEVVSYFWHGQKGKDLQSHANDCTNRVNSYTLDGKYKPADIALGLGEFIRSMTIGNPQKRTVEPIEHHSQKHKEQEADEYDEEYRRDVDLPIGPGSALNETDHWENPVLKAFKINADLSTRFSAEKTVKQYWIASCAPHAVDRATHLRGKHQEHIPVDCEQCNFEHFPLSNVDHLPEQTIRAIVSTPEAQNLYHALLVKPKDGRELTKSLLLSFHPTLGQLVRVSKNYKAPDHMPDAIVDRLINSPFIKE